MTFVAQVEAEKLSHLAAFLWAAGGSLALEVIALNNYFKAENPKGIPERYKSWAFWGVRLLLAATGGMLAIAERADSALFAINIGATTPAIMKAFERRPNSDELSE